MTAMMQRGNQQRASRNPKLPVQLPKALPSRKHAMPPESLPNLLNLCNILVFLWLRNGNQFWFFISYTRPNQLVGHAWNGSHWVDRTLSLPAIWSYY